MTSTAPVDDLAELRRLQEELEFTAIQEAYVKDELHSLQRELVRAKEEVKRIQAVPLVVGQFLELIVRGGRHVVPGQAVAVSAYQACC